MGIMKNKRSNSVLKGALTTVCFIGLFVFGVYLLGSSLIATPSSDTDNSKNNEYDLKVKFCNIIGCETYYCDEVKEISETKYELHRDGREEPYLVMDVNEDVNVKIFRSDSDQ